MPRVVRLKIQNTNSSVILISHHYEISARKPVANFIILSLGRLDSLQKLGRGILAVTLGVVLNPSPEVIAGLLHGELGLPVELLVGEGRVGSKIENVSLSSGTDLVGKIATDDLAEGLDNLKDSAATSGTQVPCLDTGLVLAQVVEGHQVTAGKVDNVDVVSDGSAVARGVVYKC
jgi:hypothetical protein